MSKTHFPVEEFQNRRSDLARALGEAGLDWLVAIHPATIHWLTGSSAKSYQGFQCAIFDARRHTVNLLVREADQAEVEADALFDGITIWGTLRALGADEAFRVLAGKLGLGRTKVGLECPDYYLSASADAHMRAVFGGDLVDATRLAHDVRLIKSELEQKIIRKASEIADASMETFAKNLKAGRSELELCGAIYQSAMERGGDQFASPINFSAGPGGAFSHGRPTDRALSSPDFGCVEYAVPFRNYPVTIGRQFAIGTPTDRQRELYSVSRAAADACIEKLVPGAKASDAYRAAREQMERAGCGDFQVHTVGYNLVSAFPPATGGRLHISAHSDYVVKEGMQLSICPPVFSADEGIGARLVDNVLIGSGGAEILSQVSREMIVVP